MTSDVLLREVIEADLPIFFDQQLDDDANYMAAFTAKDPADRAAFMAHWARILSDAGFGKMRVYDYRRGQRVCQRARQRD